MSKQQAFELELKAIHASLSEVKDMLFAIKTADDKSKGLKEVVEEIVSNIQWDIDPEDDDGVELPNEITIPNDIEDEEAISDYISDVTGFCHKGFELEEQL